MKFLAFAALLVATADAATRVAVIEVGKTGMVRRTQNGSGSNGNSVDASVDGVASFWSALHGYGRKLQHAGMPVVPDLFSRPDDGLVIGLTNVDLDSMPTAGKLMSIEQQGQGAAAAHLEVPGAHCKHMMDHLQVVQQVEDADSLAKAAGKHASEPGFSGVQMDVSAGTASDVDAKLALLLEQIASSAKETGKGIVVHLVVEEEEGSARRRLLTRKLNEDNNDQEQDGDNNKNNNADGDADGDNANEAKNGYYGYGYTNSYGEFVTPYKTMFQIQYFNVVLWTAVGLVLIVFFSIYLMVNMPLMADTLLFGEASRITSDD